MFPELHREGSIVIPVQRCGRKFSLIDDPQPWVRSLQLSKSSRRAPSLQTPCTTEGEERSPQDRLHQGLQEESNISQLVLERQTFVDHPKGSQGCPINSSAEPNCIQLTDTPGRKITPTAAPGTDARRDTRRDTWRNTQETRIETRIERDTAQRGHTERYTEKIHNKFT